MNDDTPVKLNVAEPVPYAEQLAEKHAAQKGMSRDEIKQQMVEESEFVVDPEELVAQGRTRQHNWVDRGLKLSCEGAGHPWHEVYKPIKKY
jgi:hypothetical protein